MDRQKLISFLFKRLPILSWIPQYDADKAVSDIIAGITVGLTLMPQGLAYAILAGLEPQYGLYSAFMGAIVYVVFGTCKDITIGPTALMAIMTQQYVQGKSADFAILLTFLTGCLQLMMACLHLDVLIEFISIPVTVGFTSATSVIIIASQLKGMFGLKITSSGFIGTVKAVIQNLGDTNPWDAGMGLVCISSLVLLRKVKEIQWSSRCRSATKIRKILVQLTWLISTARNAIIVIVCSTIAYKMESENGAPFVLTGSVQSGLPPIGFPPFSTRINDHNLTFLQMCVELGSAIFLVPIIGVFGNVAIARAFANSVDTTQEIWTLGLCNVLGSCASSMPVTGSFSRSAVNHASGVETPMSGLYTGLLIILALTLLTPYFCFIPKASLAAVIISAVIYMIEYKVVKLMWKTSRKDLIPMFATFFPCLVIGVEYGILVGISINLMFLIYPAARPPIIIEECITESGMDYLLVILSDSLYFPAVDFMKQFVNHAAVHDGSCLLPVVIDFKNVYGTDFTAAKGIAGLMEEFRKREQTLFFYNLKPNVLRILRGVCGGNFQYVATQEELFYLLFDTPAQRAMTMKKSELRSEVVPGSSIELTIRSTLLPPSS